jgi:hypothetical protein
MLVGVAEDGAPSGGRGANFLEATTGLAELLRIEGIAEQGFHLCLGNQGVKRDGVHVHPAVGGPGPVCCGSSPSAPAKIVLSRSVEALQGVGGMGNARVVVAVEETYRVPPSHLLGVFDESPQIGAASPLRCLSALTGKEGEQTASDDFSLGRLLAGPEDTRDADENHQALR